MAKDISFKEAIELAKKIEERFKKIEGKPWGVEGAMIELSKQVGELSKLIMSQENYYFSNRDKIDKSYGPTNEKIGHELINIFSAIIRIANHYNIDLLDIHDKTRIEENEFLKSKGV
jgi:hypothetical protein